MQQMMLSSFLWKSVVQFDKAWSCPLALGCCSLPTSDRICWRRAFLNPQSLPPTSLKKRKRTLTNHDMLQEECHAGADHVLREKDPFVWS
ncbi:hypothetical protein MUK42_23649 [Musa troglodytarum]|uniref:Uncharacterized protein n=1 Tax=Musa troglodytarum TaxID=320322 RepID=A0A9E7ERF4_9LILI|nr:hypothetical protein MUK42_23649 [Musa troglodytarum]